MLELLFTVVDPEHVLYPKGSDFGTCGGKTRFMRAFDTWACFRWNVRPVLPIDLMVDQKGSTGPLNGRVLSQNAR